MDPAVEDFGLIVSHRDQVTELPVGAQLLAASEFCPNAMFVIDDHILALQGHPEFTREYALELMQMRAELLGVNILHAGIESLQHELHSDMVSNWIVRFIAGDPA
jgi:GMP synthase-like glutamine amidotransferase